MKTVCCSTLIAWIGATTTCDADSLTINVWPGKPPGETKELPAEADQTKPEDALIAGRRIIKLGNVSTPQLAVYRPPKEKDTGASVVICPGGGHYILAYDLEGTEVAAWLNGIGVTGIVLKYRVPFRDPEKRWHAAVADAQRSMSLVRSRASEWGLDPKRIGMLGFSAGGQVTGLVSLFGAERQYQPIDEIDKVPSRPDFAVLVYPGGLTEENKPQLREMVKVTKDAPPMFFVHAFDDGVSVFNTLTLASELKKVGVSAEVHVHATGGHGYGLRHVDGQPVTDWPRACEAWLRSGAGPLSSGVPEGDRTLVLSARSRDSVGAPSIKEIRWNPRQTALVVVDMWDNHWCRGAAERVVELAEPVNRVVAEARRRGVFIIHAPSTTVKPYDGTPARERARTAPFHATPVPLATSPRWGTAWCWPDPAREPELPIDDSDMGCNCSAKCTIREAWTRQISAIEIKDQDSVSDSGQEVYNLLAERGIENVLILGVHLNMCVLGRPFAIRQLVTLGKRVVLVRDLTDTMYNSRMRPNVDHFTGTDLVVEHVEKHWCPTITSDQLLGGKPFRFRGDNRR